MSVNWINIKSGNGLLPFQHEAITWTNADLLSILLQGTNWSGILIKICKKNYIKMHYKMSSAICWPLCCSHVLITTLFLRPEYFKSIKSILWVLMLWVLASLRCLFWKVSNVFVFSAIPQNWDGAGNWKHFLMEDKHVSNIVNTMAVDGLSIQGARVSVVMAWT